MAKLFSKCENCHRRAFIIKKRGIKLPTGHVATSKQLLCHSCITKLNKALSFNQLNKHAQEENQTN